MSKSLGILVSGRGTNLQAILDAIENGKLDARVALVVSNKAGAAALDRARAAGVETLVLPHKGFPSREAFDQALVDALQASGVDWIILAGFMRLLTPVFLDAFADRVLNVHPSLLPAFPGVRAQEQAIEYGVRVTGCTVHFVDAGTDTGPIIAQSSLGVTIGETADELSSRLLKLEHQLLVDAVRLATEGKLELETGASARRRVRILP